VHGQGRGGEAGGQHPGRVEIERAQGGQAVDRDGQERAALVGDALRAGLEQPRLPTGAVQGDGGDGAGDPAAGHQS
jgi:hypothetical protein